MELIETDTGLAQLLHTFAGHSVFDRRSGWHNFDGTCWRTADFISVSAFQALSDFIRAFAEQADARDKPHIRSRSHYVLQAAGMRNIQTCAGKLSQFHATIEGDNDNPFWLNTQNCTVDLRTGKHWEHNPDDKLALCTNAPYNPDAESPRWDAFIKNITCDDTDLAEYLQRVAGYCATGSTREQVMFYLLGESGMNGKTTFTETLRYVMGNYTSSATSRILTKADSDFERATLYRVRLISVAELPESQSLNEETIKRLTGSDSIQACFKHRDYFSYTPTGKFVVASNDRLQLEGGQASWRRIRVIPFNRSFYGAADRNLASDLKAEAPGILRWIIEGAKAWSERGLLTPDVVRDATVSYRRLYDTFEVFKECVEVGDDSDRVRPSDLYNHYITLCNSVSAKPMTQTMFGRKCTAAGWARRRMPGDTNPTYGLRLVKQKALPEMWQPTVESWAD